MNSIVGFTDLILMDSNQIPEERRDSLEIIRNSGKLLLTLINDILDISKIEAGQFRFENKAFSLSEVLRAVEHSARGIMTRKGHHMIDFITPSKVANVQDGNFDSDPMTVAGIEDRIMGDPTRLM